MANTSIMIQPIFLFKLGLKAAEAAYRIRKVDGNKTSDGTLKTWHEGPKKDQLFPWNKVWKSHNYRFSIIIL